MNVLLHLGVLLLVLVAGQASVVRRDHTGPNVSKRGRCKKRDAGGASVTNGPQVNTGDPDENTDGYDVTTWGSTGTTEYVYTWPQGQYGLMMAGGLCPEGGNFEEGRRYQDLESKKSKWNEESMGLSGEMSKEGFELVFCTKTATGESDHGDWPAGRYCIHRVGGSCPTGFESGSITFDDDNENNANREEGTLPDGEYGTDTKYFYCCRNDGKVSEPIDIHNSEPFYLYAYIKNRCQEVKGMVVVKESLKFDLEKSDPQNQQDGTVPKIKLGKDITLNTCLYTPEGWAQGWK